jgi:hypothetical protein
MMYALSIRSTLVIGARSAARLATRGVCVVLLVFAGWVASRGHELRANEDAPVGKYTGHEAIKRAAPVMWKLMEFDPELVLNADSADTGPNAPYPMHRWIVSCRRQSGQELAVVTFDAVTSRLRSACLAVRSSRPWPQRPTRRDASLTAERWLTSLGPEEGSSRWAVREVITTPHSWAVRFSNGERRATAMVDVESGRLCSVILSP